MQYILKNPKTLLLALIITTFFIFPLTPLNASTLTKPLKLGMTDPEVKILQIYLNTHGYTIANIGNGSPNNETTYFGQKTKDAVIKFQLASSMTPDGVVGPVVRAFINNQSTPPPIVTPRVCIGSALFNIITGAPCNPSESICGPGVLFNSITGAHCANTTVCAHGVLFNSVTGQPCTTVPRTGGSSGGGGGRSGSLYTLTTSSSGTGLGTLSGTEAGEKNKNTLVTITATPDESSNFIDWQAEGSASSCDRSINPTCSFTITNNTLVVANFTLKTFAITSSHNSNGTITATETVNYGSSKTFTITPNEGYHILDVLVDDVSVGAVSTYTFTNVTATHTIEATFTINTSSDKEITSFTFSTLSPVVTGVIDQNNHTIFLTVPFGTNLINIVPTIIHTGDFVSPASGVAHSFVDGVQEHYTVTASDTTTQIYTVTVNIITLAVGQSYEGGTIFYILQDGDFGYEEGKVKGLISYQGDIGWKIWGDQSQYVYQTENEIGFGDTNTQRIISILGQFNSGDYAANQSDLFSYGGFTDWYLPSRDELFKLYQVKTLVPEIASNGIYWTSSEYTEVSSWYAWTVDFENGLMSAVRSKNIALRIIPIRSFSVDI